MLRRLTGADAAAFQSLRRRALAEEPQAFGESVEEFERTALKDIEARLDSNPAESFVLGTFEAGQLTGTAGLYREARLKRRHTAGVWGIYLAPEVRGRGLAEKLMQALVEEAKKMEGVDSLHLTVGTTQIAAQRLYRGLGFESYGIEKRALRTSAGFFDEDHMVLFLDRANS